MDRLNIGESSRGKAKKDFNTDYKMNISINNNLFNPKNQTNMPNNMPNNANNMPNNANNMPNNANNMSNNPNNMPNIIKSEPTRKIVQPKSFNDNDRKLFDPDRKTVNSQVVKDKIAENPKTYNKEHFIQKKENRTGSYNYYSKENEYIPETTEKRKFSNIIYNQLITKFKKIDNKTFTQYDVDRLFIKYNLSENENEWDLDQKNNFISGVRSVINLKKKDNIVDKNLFEKDTKMVTHLVSIDSKDRDKSKWPNINNYRIDFAPTNNIFDNENEKHGYVGRSFNNVISIELCQVIMPRKAIDGNDLDDYPYIIISIDEFDGVYQGTNDIMNKAFAKITFDRNIGKYKEFSTNNSNNDRFIKKFNPRIGINKLTINFLTPDGNPYNFGSDIRDNKEIMPMTCNEPTEEKTDNFNPDDNTLDNKMKLFKEGTNIEDEFTLNKNQIHILDKKDKISPENSLLFKITCYQRALETMYLNRRDS